MRLVLQATFRRDFDRALAEVVAGGILRPDDIAALKSELPAFETAVWQVWFLQEASSQSEDISAHDVGRRFGMALAFAAADIRPDKDQAIAETEDILARYGVYLDACGEAHSAASPMADAALAMIQTLAARVLPDADLRNAADSDRRLQVITIGRDSYRMIEAAFAEQVNKWKLAYTS